MTRHRRGIALLAVLWVIAVLGATVAQSVVETRVGVTAAENRGGTLRAFWRARACVATTIADLGRSYAEYPDPVLRRRAWRRGDAMGGPSAADGCDLRWEPVGRALPIELAQEASVAAALTQRLGLTNADAMLAALRDWQDADDEVSPGGAESEWYRARLRVVPSNSAVASLKELQFVRGWEAVPTDSLPLVLRRERVSLDHAPAGVLAVIPGFSLEVVEYVIGRRQAGRHLHSLHELVDNVSPGARARLMSEYDVLNRLVVADTEAWLLHARAVDSSTGVAVTVTARIEQLVGAIVVAQVWIA